MKNILVGALVAVVTVAAMELASASSVEERFMPVPKTRIWYATNGTWLDFDAPIGRMVEPKRRPVRKWVAHTGSHPAAKPSKRSTAGCSMFGMVLSNAVGFIPVAGPVGPIMGVAASGIGDAYYYHCAEGREMGLGETYLSVLTGLGLPYQLAHPIAVWLSKDVDQCKPGQGQYGGLQENSPVTQEMRWAWYLEDYCGGPKGLFAALRKEAGKEKKKVR